MMINARLIFWMLLVYNAQFCAIEKQPTTIYCHGLGGSKYEVQGLIHESIIQYPAKGVQFKNENDSCLGHRKNVETLNNQIDPQETYILYGISCGGVGIISWLVQYGSKTIQAIIIDATPSDIVNLVEEAQYKIGFWVLWTRAHKEWALHRLFPEYPKASMPPVQAIAHIENKELPVFIVHSHNDPIVDIRAAWENYKAFKQAGFNNVYICELQQGGHMSNASGPDSLVYKFAVNSFFKKYDLAHDKKYAILTDKELQQFQPSEEEIDIKLSHNLSKLRKQGFINFGIYNAIEQFLAFSSSSK